jgi:hypothetical protein
MGGNRGKNCTKTVVHTTQLKYSKRGSIGIHRYIKT